MDMCDYLFELTNVTFTSDGQPIIQIPTWREIRRNFLAQNIRLTPPDETDPVWRVLHARIKRFIPVARAARSSSVVVRVPAWVAPTPAGDEAAVRQMKGSEVANTLRSLGLSVKPHPTNPGITSMRGKNCLYNYLRRGGRLAQPAPSANTSGSAAAQPVRAVVVVAPARSRWVVG